MRLRVPGRARSFRQALDIEARRPVVPGRQASQITTEPGILPGANEPWARRAGEPVDATDDTRGAAAVPGNGQDPEVEVTTREPDPE